MSTWAYVSVFGAVIVLALYLSNAFERIVEIEKRLDALEEKENPALTGPMFQRRHRLCSITFLLRLRCQIPHLVLAQGA
jgi:hypothetical protein